MDDISKIYADKLATYIEGAQVYTERVTSSAKAPYFLVKTVERSLHKELSGIYMVRDIVEVIYKPEEPFLAVLSEMTSLFAYVLQKSELPDAPKDIEAKFTDEGKVSIKFTISYRAALDTEAAPIITDSKIKILIVE